MNYHIYNPSDFSTKLWSGGKTTELYIYPPESSYSALDFKFRLSTASVEIENSVFTALPDVSRQLLVLEGEIALHHEQHHASTLNVLEVDCFEGVWNTTCQGMCTDFNLMTIKPASGKLSGLKLKLYERKSLNFREGLSFAALYLFRGATSVIFNDEYLNLASGQLLIFNDITECELQFFANGNCIMAVVEIE